MPFICTLSFSLFQVIPYYTTSPALFFLPNFGIVAHRLPLAVGLFFSSLVASPYALRLPFLRPVLTSRLLAQQQLRERCTNHPKMLKALATHMNANISVPILAPIFNPDWDVATFLKMIDMTVPIMVAAVVRRAAMNVQIANGKDHHLEYSVIGAKNIDTKFMQIPVKKKPNMT